MSFKKFTLTVLAVTIALSLVGMYFQYKYQVEILERKTALVSNSILEELKNDLSIISNFEIRPYSHLASTEFKGFVLMDLKGKVLHSLDIPLKMIGKYSNMYKYVVLNGMYVSPLNDSDGSPTIFLASNTSDGKYIAGMEIFLAAKHISNAFIIDSTGLGVSLSGKAQWKNMMTLLAKRKNEVFVRGSTLFILKKLDLGGYSVLFDFSIPSILISIFHNDYIFWILILLIVMIYYIHDKATFSRIKPLMDFVNFMKSIDNFKRYEPPKSNEAFFKYNSLVDKSEKMSRDYSNLIEEMSEINSELTQVNHLLIEFSMLFNEVKTNRKDLESALKIALRRMLDFSRTINGIGMRYKDISIHFGTVNDFNFDRENPAKLSMELKTDSSTVKYVISIDRFATAEKTHDMVKTLLYYITSFISMYEMLEQNRSSMRYDPLTNLLTRHEFEENANHELVRAKRENQFLSFIMLNVKDMTGFNEKYGHLNGDVLLKQIAKEITMNSRFTDLSCRYAEDKFMLCLIEMKKEDALGKVKKMISHISTFKHRVEMKYAIASFPSDGEKLDDLLIQLEKGVKEQKKD